MKTNHFYKQETHMDYIKKNKSNNVIILFMIASIITAYLFTSYYWSRIIPIERDTLEYLYNFDNIFNIPFPYGIEFITNIFMYTVKLVGGDFRDFLFISYLLWIPIIAHLIKLIRYNFVFIIAVIYFFTEYFFLNAAFLIRQYYSAIFFFLYLYSREKRNKVWYIFLFLSILSHLSSLLWIVISSKKFISFINHKSRFYIFFFLIIILFNINVFGNIIDILNFIAQHTNLDEINRKLFYYTKNEGIPSSSVDFKYIILAFLSFALSYYALIKKNNDNLLENRTLSIIIAQSFLIIISHENLVFANRLGFFVFFFYLPSVSYCTSIIYRNIKTNNSRLNKT